MPLFCDTHCHLQSNRLIKNVDAVVSRALAAGVERMVCCGTREADWELVADLARKHPQKIIPAFGVHPWYLQGHSVAWLERLREYLMALPYAVVGEIGLDHANEKSDRAEQYAVFLAQMELAHELKRPVSVHCRRAWDVLLAVVQKLGPLPHGGAIHSYSGSVDMAQTLRRYGFAFAYSGSLTRPRNKHSKASLTGLPLDSILLETDSPDIPPEGVEPPNEPMHLPKVAVCMAEVLGKRVDEVASLTSRNAERIFQIEGLGTEAQRHSGM
jgi:TatD DNase family protein